MISHKDLKPNNFYKKFVPSGYWYMYIYTVGENIISQWVCKHGKDDAVVYAPAGFYFEDGWEQASLDNQAFENISPFIIKEYSRNNICM